MRRFDWFKRQPRPTFTDAVFGVPALPSAIGAALFDVWKPYLEDWPGDRPPRATSADAFLSLTNLESIMLELPGRVRLGYGFAEGGDWDDAVLTVELTDWHISDSCLSD